MNKEPTNQTPDKGKRDDCFKRLSQLEQQRVSIALADKSPVDAAQLMQSRGMCERCIVYYSYAALTILFRGSGVEEDTLINASAYAIAAAYAEER